MAMKKKIVYTFLCLMLSASVAFCAPVLTADCSPDADMVTGAQLQLNNGAWQDIPVVSTCRDLVCASNAKTFCYDLSALPNGSFTFKARFLNLWGV